MRIHPSEFTHPEDAAARLQLEAIPGFAQVVKLVMRIGLEQFLHGRNMATKIRLSNDQLPDLYKRLPPICSKLGIEEPEFYLEMDPNPNATTFGDTRIFLTVTSGLLEHLDDDELDAVIAHECGHIACRHVLYHTMGRILITGAASFGLAGNLISPLQLGLLYWSRRSELSADRAACAVMGSPGPVVETMIRLAGGPKSITEKVNVEVFAEQAKDYELLKEKTWDRILQTYAVMNNQHPFQAVRVREIRKWADTDQFRNMAEVIKNQDGTQCPVCHASVSNDWMYCKNCGHKLKR